MKGAVIGLWIVNIGEEIARNEERELKPLLKQGLSSIKAAVFFVNWWRQLHDEATTAATKRGTTTANWRESLLSPVGHISLKQ